MAMSAGLDLAGLGGSRGGVETAGAHSSAMGLKTRLHPDDVGAFGFGVGHGGAPDGFARYELLAESRAFEFDALFGGRDWNSPVGRRR